MGKLIVGLLLFVFAALLFMPALLVSIMSSDSSPQAGTPLPVIIDLLIGFIGLILGIWRLGTRYETSLLHVGAIVAIFLPFVGWLLIWIGARDARRLRRRHHPCQLHSFPARRDRARGDSRRGLRRALGA